MGRCACIISYGDGGGGGVLGATFYFVIFILNLHGIDGWKVWCMFIYHALHFSVCLPVEIMGDFRGLRLGFYAVLLSALYTPWALETCDVDFLIT